MIKREVYMDAMLPFVDTEIIKVLTGVRRSGKSVMLRLVQMHLESLGVKPSQIISLNFESLDNEQLLNYQSLNQHLEAFVAGNKEKSYIFLDEVQLVESFEKVVNSLRAKHADKVDIYLAGSNSNLLSGELATLLGGRFVRFEIYPFKFSEYVQGKRSVGDLRSEQDLFQSYIIEGGMPLLVFQDFTYANRSTYLEDVYNSVVLRDIIAREGIRDTALLIRLLRYVLANVGRTFSANSIVKYLKNEGIQASVTTILNYLEYAKHAYAIIPVGRFDVQGKKFLSTQEKYYVVDHGLRQAVVGRNEADIEVVLENIVLLELKARGYEVYVGKTNQYEIDFVAERKIETGLDRKYIQVSYLLASAETRTSEFRPLLEVKDGYEKIVLSLDPITADMEGVRHYRLVDWLLSE